MEKLLKEEQIKSLWKLVEDIEFYKIYSLKPMNGGCNYENA